MHEAQPDGMLNTVTTGNVQSHEAVVIVSLQISESHHCTSKRENDPRRGCTLVGLLVGTVLAGLVFCQVSLS